MPSVFVLDLVPSYREACTCASKTTVASCIIAWLLMLMLAWKALSSSVFDITVQSMFRSGMLTTSHEWIAESELKVMWRCQKLIVRYVSRFFRPCFLRNYILMWGLFVSLHSGDSGVGRRQTITGRSPLVPQKHGPVCKLHCTQN